MGNKKITSTVIHWNAEPFLDRLHKCRAMLAIHGLLTDKENDRVTQRIRKKAIAMEKATTTARPTDERAR